MTKYKIEGGVDFFSELYKSLDDEDKENEENLCLISDLPLIDKYFQMDCGHKFNYIPLFMDTKNHKQKFNGMEGSSSRLNNNEIRCPYCRKRHKGVLPYYEELGLPKIEGVNNINPNYKVHHNSSNYKHCQFLTPNPSFDPSGNNVLETSQGNSGNCKFHVCFHMGSKINFQYGLESGENYGDDKYYCYSHKKQMIKKYKTEITNKAKEEAKQVKLLAKEEAKKQKEEAKQKAKDEKKQKKTIATSSENVVISNNIFDTSGNIATECCLEILKSGTNKGTQCGCVIYNNNMCKRHYSLQEKKTKKDFINGHYS